MTESTKAYKKRIKELEDRETSSEYYINKIKRLEWAVEESRKSSFLEHEQLRADLKTSESEYKNLLVISLAVFAFIISVVILNIS